VQIDLGSEQQHVSVVYIVNRLLPTTTWNKLLTATSASMAGVEFSGANEGAVVGVSQTPCAANGGSTAACGGAVCATITNNSAWADESWAVVVTCPAGTMGRYLYLQLRGSGRLLHISEMRANYADTCGTCMARMGFNYV